MSRTTRRLGAATCLFLSLLLAPAAFAAEQPAAPAPQEEAPRGLTVYFPEEETPEPQAAVPALAPAPRPASPWSLILPGLILAGAVLAWMRLRAPLCPRCRTKMSVLEPEGDASGRPGVQVLACPGCDEVMRRKHRMILTADRRCPACGRPAKVSRLVPLERPGYLTWGRMRVDDECASCDYRSSVHFAVPVLEAPPRQRPRSRTV